MTTTETGRELLWTPSEIGGSGHREARLVAGCAAALTSGREEGVPS
jgi:hypothetical protein